MRTNSTLLFLQNMVREQVIGINPKYDHSRGRSETARSEDRKEWQARLDEFERRVQK